MLWKRKGLAAIGFLTTLGTLAVAQSIVGRVAAAQAGGAVQAPRFEVDPFWPKPLPNHWLLGSTIGTWVDASDNVWIIHRSSSTLNPTERGAELKIADCCTGAPPVLEFDKQGNLKAHWGGPGPGYEWPESNHGIFIDHKGAVWIGGNGGGDSHVLKFTQDGKFLMQIGKPKQSKGSNDIENLKGPAKLFIDPRNDELYVADGYGNRHVIIGDTNVVWSCHTDSVHHDEGRQVVLKRDGRFMLKPQQPANPSCLGADCATGVWIMRNMILRGIPGHFPKTLDAIRRLKAAGLTVQINTTVMRDNVDEMADIAEILVELGCDIWEVFFLVHVGRGVASGALTPEEHEDVCNFLWDASHYGFIVRTVEGPFFRRVVKERREHSAAGLRRGRAAVPSGGKRTKGGAHP